MKVAVLGYIMHLFNLFVGTRMRTADCNRPTGGRVRSPHCCRRYIIQKSDGQEICFRGKCTYFSLDLNYSATSIAPFNVETLELRFPHLSSQIILFSGIFSDCVSNYSSVNILFYFKKCTSCNCFSDSNTQEP